MNKPKTDPYVIVHGGVVKTASSYMQAILQRNAGRLRKQGVVYVHHRTTRKEYTVPCQLNCYEKLGFNYKTKISDAGLSKLSDQFFRDISAKSGERIILSDENLAGHSGQCARSGRVLPHRQIFTSVFAQNIPYQVKEVHIAIRNYADFFASTYVEFLRSAVANRLVPENTMKRLVVSNVESWTKLLVDVSAAFPQAQITVWRHENLRDLSDTIIQNLCGATTDISNLATPKRARARPSASHKAVTTLQNAIDRLGAGAAIDQWADIQQTFPRGPEFPAYDPWTATERAHLTRLYEADVQELAALPRVSLLQP